LNSVYNLIRLAAEKIKSLDDTTTGVEAKNIALEKAKKVYELAVRIERLSPETLYHCIDTIELPGELSDKLEDLYSLLSSMEEELHRCHREALLKRHHIKASVYAASLLVFASSVLLASINASPGFLLFISTASALSLAGMALNKYMAGSFSILASASAVTVYGIISLAEGLHGLDIMFALTTSFLSVIISLYSIVTRGSKSA